MNRKAKKRHTDAASYSTGIDPIKPKRRRQRGLSRRLKIKLAIMTGDTRKAENLLGRKICSGQSKTELLRIQSGLTSKDLERSGSSLLESARRIELKSGSRSIRNSKRIKSGRKFFARRNHTKKNPKPFSTSGIIVRRADGRPVLLEGQSHRLPHPSRVRGYLLRDFRANVTASTCADRRVLADAGMNDELTG